MPYTLPRGSVAAARRPSALRTGLFVLAWILLGEALVMAVLPYVLPPDAGWLAMVLDSLALGLICLPAIWYGLIRPLVRAHDEARSVATSVLATMPEAVIAIDSQGAILDCNDGVTACFGHSRDALLGRNVSCLMPEPHASAHDRYLATYLETGRARIVGLPFGTRPRLEGLHASGHVIPVDVSVHRLDSGAGPVFVGVVQDLSKLEAAEAARRAFLANMSHEIRTPLNGILGFADLLRRQPLDPVGRDFAEVIHSSGSSLLALLDGILDYSRLESGAVKLDEAPFDLRQVLESVVDAYGPAAQAKGLELIGRLRFTGAMLLLGDASRLRQILLQLIGNALKVTREGEVELRADCEERPAEVALRLSVRDTGPGIAPDRLAQLFEGFVPVDASPTRTHGGAGVGLAAARALAHRMGGEVRVESAVGQGSTFTLSLVLPRAWAPEHVGPGPLARRLAALPVLVVDRPASGAAAVETLVRLGCAAALATDESTVLEELERAAAAGQPWRALILSTALADLDRAALILRVRARWDASLVPVLLLASYSRVELTAEDLALSVAVLSRPAKEAALVHHLLTHVPDLAPAVGPDG